VHNGVTVQKWNIPFFFSFFCSFIDGLIDGLKGGVNDAGEDCDDLVRSM